VVRSTAHRFVRNSLHKLIKGLHAGAETSARVRRGLGLRTAAGIRSRSAKHFRFMESFSLVIDCITEKS
jgi:hypothetical protein